jgi:hypothetical protein
LISNIALVSPIANNTSSNSAESSSSPTRTPIILNIPGPVRKPIHIYFKRQASVNSQQQVKKLTMAECNSLFDDTSIRHEIRSLAEEIRLSASSNHLTREDMERRQKLTNEKYNFAVDLKHVMNQRRLFFFAGMTQDPITGNLEEAGMDFGNDESELDIDIKTDIDCIFFLASKVDFLEEMVNLYPLPDNYLRIKPNTLYEKVDNVQIPLHQLPHLHLAGFGPRELFKIFIIFPHMKSDVG